MLSSRRFNAGTVHYLDFNKLAPEGSEMIKGRGVVIISPTSRRQDDLVIVVPLSKKPPETHKKHTVCIFHDELNGSNGGSWAKCDMPMTVSTSRLSDYRRPRHAGQNDIPSVSIGGDELRRVREAMMRAIGAKEIFQRLRAAALAARDNKPKPKSKASATDKNAKRSTTGVNRPVPAKKKLVGPDV